MKPSRRFPFHFLIGLSLLLLGAACSPEAKKSGYIESGDRFYAAGDLNSAEVEFLNVLQLDPANGHAIAKLGMIYSDQGRLGRAVAYIRRGHELLPEDLDLRIKVAQMHMAGGQLQEARTHANYILERRPGDPDAPLILASTVATPEDMAEIRARLQGLPAPANEGAPALAALAMLELRQGNAAQGEALLQRSLAADPDFSAAHAMQGSLHLSRNDLAAGDQAFKRAADTSPPRSPRRLQYAQLKIRTGDQVAGRAILEEITQATPDYAPAWVALAELSFMENKLPESSDFISRALTRDPDNLEARLLEGRLFLAKGEHTQAVNHFTRLAEVFPRLPVAHFELARAHLATGESNRAITSLNQAVSLAPNHAESVMMLASLNIRQGNHGAAIALLRRLLPERPDLLQAHLVLAEAYRGQGSFEDALSLYGHIGEQFPQFPGTPLGRGQVLLQLGRTAEAAEAFVRAMELNPDNPTPLEQLVDIDLRAGNHQAGRDRVQAAVAANPKLAGPGRLLVAKTYLAERNLEQAEIILKEAIELMPDNPTVYFLLAGVYNETNQVPLALARLADVIERNPRDYAALMLSGVLHSQQKDNAAARDTYEKALAINPGASAALNNLAYLYAESYGELEKAQQLAQRARDLAPTSPNIADTLGWILYAKGDYARALSLLQEAANGLPDSGEVQYHLGMAYYMQGQEESARAALQRALESGEEFVGLDEARNAVAVLETSANGDAASSRAALENMIASRNDDPVALARLAAIHESEGRTDQAINTLTRALEINPRNVNVLISMARLHAANQDTARAMEYARTARQHAPVDPVVAHTLGRLAYRMGDYSWSASLLQESARRQPPTPELLLDLAESVYSVGQVDEAQAALRDALAPSAGSGPNLTVFPREEEARQFLALIALAANPAEAQRQSATLESTLNNDPANVPALMAMGAAYEQRPDATAARQAYEKALARFPDFTPAKRRLAILGASRTDTDQKTFDYAIQARLTYPNDPELAKALGILNYRRNDPTRAVSLLRESASARTNDAELFYFLGRAQLQGNDSSGARQSLERALQLGLPANLATEAREVIEGLDGGK